MTVIIHHSSGIYQKYSDIDRIDCLPVTKGKFQHVRLYRVEGPIDEVVAIPIQNIIKLRTLIP